MKPTYKRANFNRGIANLGLKNYEEAILDFTKEIELYPDNDSAYYERAIAFSRLDKYTSALDDYAKAIELNPDNADYYAERGALISKSEGDLQKPNRI